MNVSTNQLTPVEQAAADRLPILVSLRGDASAEAARAEVAAVTPVIIADALGDHETEHIVQFEETTFSVQHPLSERLDGSLFDCPVHADISALAGPPVPPGRYRATAGVPGCYHFEPVAVTLSRPTAEKH